MIGTATKIPWITEENIWRGLPKTSRIPTGGWRGYGAVPSHSYPQPSVLPDGYWSGLGMVASTHHAAAQNAKAYCGFGQTEPTPESLRLQAARLKDAGKTAEAAALEAQAAQIEAQSKSTTAAWTGALAAIAQAGVTAYTAHQAYKAGVPVVPVALPSAGAAAAEHARTEALHAETTGRGSLVLVGLAGVGLLAFMLMKKKR